MTALRIRLSRRSRLLCVAVAVVLAPMCVTGCGRTTSGSVAGPTPDTTPDPTAVQRVEPQKLDDAVGFRVTYRLASPDGGELNFDKLEVLTDGRARVREMIGEFGVKGNFSRVVTDGSRAVGFNAADKGGYGVGSTYQTLKVSEVQHYVLPEGDAALTAWCVDAKVAAAAEVLGRPARHYVCRDPGWEELTQAKELWVDRQTGLILKWVPGGDSNHDTATAIRIDLNAPLAADAFSLRPQPGATVTH
jgi:hypothetical protein